MIHRFSMTIRGWRRTATAAGALALTVCALVALVLPTQESGQSSLNNGYQVTQFYHGAVYPDGSTFFGGTQDNGTLRGTVPGGQNWLEISGGDGGYVAVNRDNTDVLYSEFTGKSLQRSLDGGINWSPIHGRVQRGAGRLGS